MSETFAMNKSIGIPLKGVDNGDDTASLATFQNLFGPPTGTDAGTVDYPDEVTEVYSFRSGGTAGTILRTLTLVYATSAKIRLASWSTS